MEYMRTLQDKAFDLAVVDPPYGIGIDGQKLSINKNPKHNRKEHAKRGWDTHIPPLEYFRELERVSKNQIYGVQIILSPRWNMGIKAGSCGTKANRI
jgi:site-specific DNA-methyltransferase (adenine-specific)